MSTRIPYVNLAGQHQPLREEILNAVGSVLDSGQFILGEETGRFEQEFAALCGVKYAIGVNSGTDALVLALKCLGIGPGDEVITAPNSYLASASCIALAGATPKFADVRPDMNLDPAAVARAITPRTRAIIPVHLTGKPAAMPELLAVAQQHGLEVIEDAAQAVGAKLEGRPVGGWGRIGCFSLHPLKNLNACGDGGVLVTNEEAICQRVKLLRNHGQPNRNDCLEFSLVSRLDSVQAAILRVKLRHLEELTARRRANAEHYRRRLAGCARLQCPAEAPGEFCVYHTFIVQADKRDELVRYLEARGIGTAIHYPTPIHLMTVGRKLGHQPGDFPETERQAGRILSLPVYPELTPAQLDEVADAVLDFYRTN
ncbi:MAG: DegT/DnrJ/EryC1/StrS family aminotransferase [Verrucomicrobia bacterium]|nr:DegT/DnrJ/EryC1/StrS family aminotransferase [Verrucomicrobiota bacterium]